jgi:hypothetical protein
VAAPVGRWRIIVNGFRGDLDINCGLDGRIYGTTRIDKPYIDPINGVWDEAGQKIVFRRNVTAAGGSAQNYTGFLFEVDAPLFKEGTYGPSQKPKFRMLVGSFDAYGTGGSEARPLYGWVAQQQI